MTWQDSVLRIFCVISHFIIPFLRGRRELSRHISHLEVHNTGCLISEKLLHFKMGLKVEFISPFNKLNLQSGSNLRCKCSVLWLTDHKWTLVFSQTFLSRWELPSLPAKASFFPQNLLMFTLQGNHSKAETDSALQHPPFNSPGSLVSCHPPQGTAQAHSPIYCWYL